jgi:hypothetical protein
LCVLAVTVPIGLWIGSFILRSAVGLTNKVLGGAEPTDLDFYGESPDYRSGRFQSPTRTGLATPVPSPGKAMGIVFFIWLVDAVVQFGIMMAAGAGSALGNRGGNGGLGQAMAVLIAIPVSFVVHTVMLSSLLPTSLGRAFLIMVFELVMSVLIGVVIVAVVVVLVGGMAGTR